MELSRLEKYKIQFKSLTSKIDSLQSYLLAEIGGGKTMSIITPYSVSKKLGISELDVIFLLSLAEKENLVHKKYQVWTNDSSTLLGDYESENNIPEVITNLETGKDVDRDNYYVDLVFEVER